MPCRPLASDVPLEIHAGPSEFCIDELDGKRSSQESGRGPENWINRERMRQKLFEYGSPKAVEFGERKNILQGRIDLRRPRGVEETLPIAFQRRPVRGFANALKGYKPVSRIRGKLNRMWAICRIADVLDLFDASVGGVFQFENRLRNREPANGSPGKEHTREEINLVPAPSANEGIKPFDLIQYAPRQHECARGAEPVILHLPVLESQAIAHQIYRLGTLQRIGERRCKRAICVELQNVTTRSQ